MNVKVRVTEVFRARFKRLQRKFPSLASDLLALEKKLQENPQLGISLGHGAYKVRLAIKSKGRGKSGGARVITYVEKETYEDETEGFIIIVNLITLYDKSEVATITDQELKAFIKDIQQ